MTFIHVKFTNPFNSNCGKLSIAHDFLMTTEHSWTQYRTAKAHSTRIKT